MFIRFFSRLIFSLDFFFPPSMSRRLPSVIQPAAAVMPRQWSFRSLPCPKHHLSKCPERHHGHHTDPLAITDPTSIPALVSIFSVSSTCTTPPSPTSSAELFPGPANLPAAVTTPNSGSKSAVVSNNFPTSHSNASPYPFSPPALQIHLLRLLVPASLLSSSELLLGAGSESPAFCAPPPCPLRHYHSQ